MKQTKNRPRDSGPKTGPQKKKGVQNKPMVAIGAQTTPQTPGRISKE